MPSPRRRWSHGPRRPGRSSSRRRSTGRGSGRSCLIPGLLTPRTSQTTRRATSGQTGGLQHPSWAARFRQGRSPSPRSRSSHGGGGAVAAWALRLADRRPEASALRPRTWVRHPFGNPADCWSPVALRPRLATGVLFRGGQPDMGRVSLRLLPRTLQPTGHVAAAPRDISTSHCARWAIRAPEPGPRTSQDHPYVFPVRATPGTASVASVQRRRCDRPMRSVHGPSQHSESRSGDTRTDRRKQADPATAANVNEGGRRATA